MSADRLPEKERLNVVPGPVDDDWHVTHAAAAESDVRAIQRWLEETDVLVELFEGDPQVERALHIAAALLRERRNGLVDHARKLRAILQDAAR